MLILDELLDGLRAACATFPDKRKGGEVVYSMLDVGMAGFAPFFMQSESFLAHQRSLEERRKTSNCQSLFGMAKIPTDNHIRSMLDPVAPSLPQPVFDQTLAAFARGFPREQSRSAQKCAPRYSRRVHDFASFSSSALPLHRLVVSAAAAVSFALRHSS